VANKKISTPIFILALIVGGILIVAGGITFGTTTIAGVGIIIGAFVSKGVKIKDVL
tara:strand:+ start:25 stop:192 length:168 start_codon:yes stop_codon:yes gene_type:complete